MSPKRRRRRRRPWRRRTNCASTSRGIGTAHSLISPASVVCPGVVRAGCDPEAPRETWGGHGRAFLPGAKIQRRRPVAKDRLGAARRAREDAARIGRTLQRTRPELIRPDWDEVKMNVMRAAPCEDGAHAAPRWLLWPREARRSWRTAVRLRVGHRAGRVRGQSAGNAMEIRDADLAEER